MRFGFSTSMVWICSSVTPFARRNGFIYCEEGITDNDLENTKPEHIAAGANVLLNAVLTYDAAFKRTAWYP